MHSTAPIPIPRDARRLGLRGRGGGVGPLQAQGFPEFLQIAELGNHRADDLIFRQPLFFQLLVLILHHPPKFLLGPAGLGGIRQGGK